MNVKSISILTKNETTGNGIRQSLGTSIRFEIVQKIDKASGNNTRASHGQNFQVHLQFLSSTMYSTYQGC